MNESVVGDIDSGDSVDDVIAILTEDHFCSQKLLFDTLNGIPCGNRRVRIQLKKIENIDLGLFQYLIALKLEHKDKLSLEIETTKEGRDLLKHAGLSLFFDKIVYF